MKVLRRKISGHIGSIQSPKVLRGFLPMLSARNHCQTCLPFHRKIDALLRKQRCFLGIHGVEQAFMPAVMPLKEWALATEVNSSQGTAIQKPQLAVGS